MTQRLTLPAFENKPAAEIDNDAVQERAFELAYEGLDDMTARLTLIGATAVLLAMVAKTADDPVKKLADMLAELNRASGAMMREALAQTDTTTHEGLN